MTTEAARSPQANLDENLAPIARIKPRFALLADAACLLVLLAFALTVCAPVLSGGVPVATDALGLWGPLAKTPIDFPHNAALADSALEYLPDQVFIRNSLAGGEWPLWNPGILSGFPFAGEFQSQLYYPVSWLLWLLPLGLAFAVSAALHVWLAGVGMFLFARVLGASRWGALLGGLAFAGSGQLITSLEFPGVSNIYVWLPWVMWAAESAWQRKSWAWSAFAAILFGVTAVAGNPQWLLYSALFVILWLGMRWLASVWDNRRRRLEAGTRRAFVHDGLRALAIVVGGFALAAVHIFPFVELASLSSRVSASLPTASDNLHDVGQRLVDYATTLVVPQFLGTSAGMTGNPLTFNNCWYVGLPALLLAPLAVALRRDRRILLLGAVGLVGIGVAMQVWPFVLLHRLPGLQAQLPERAAYLFIFCAAALTGPGFDSLVSLAKRRPRTVLALGVGLAVFAGAAGVLLVRRHTQSEGDSQLYKLQANALKQAAIVSALMLLWLVGLGLLWLVGKGRGGKWRQYGVSLAAILLVGVTFYDLLRYIPGYNTYVSADTLTPHASAADIMKEDQGVWRMIAPDQPTPTFVPNTPVLFGLPYVGGYLSLQLSRYRDFWLAADQGQDEDIYLGTMLRPQNYSSAQADLLNVKYISSVAQLGKVGQRKLDAVIPLESSSVAQTFQAPERLTTIRVAFETYGRINQAPVTLHVRHALTETQDLVTSTVDPSGWQGRPWIDFNFPPLDNANSERMVFTVESKPKSKEQAVGVMSSNDSRYEHGILILDGKRTSRDIAFVAFGIVPAKWERIFDGPNAVYRNNAALPRAFTVGAAQVFTASEIPRLLAKGYDPRRAVMLEEAPPPGFEGTPGDTSVPGSAIITAYHNLSVDVSVQMSRPGWLALGDVNYPGWQAEVDGQPTRIYTAYYILRAVPLSAGAHNVHFAFRPTSVLVGGVISLAALLSALGVLVATYVRYVRRCSRSAAPDERRQS